jgi:alginate O-acetyltransferase complex protein AlgI
MIADYTRLTTADAWLAALGYALQLYFDFSGYSDMAVGLGHLFGIRIPQNFDAPYRAVSITDFWRRWHISLSSWLRDYLYIPLGGNRVGAVRTYANLLVTMVLGGLWHGANWTFVIWGGYHGLLLALERGCRGLPLRLPLVLARASTFLLVLVGWVVFRSTDLTMALTWLGRMFSPAALAVTAPRELYFWVLLGLGLITLLPETWDLRFGTSRRWLTVYATMFFVAYLFMNGKQTVFLYYQF